MSEKNKYDEAYEKGKEDAKKDDILSQWIHDNFSKPFSSTKKEKSYDAGYKDGQDEKSGSWCFITSACIEGKGLPDDCLEIQVLRQFRDTFILKQFYGSFLVDQYNQIAPRIVAEINKRPDASEIYRELYDELVAPSVAMIRSNEPENALRHYLATVSTLKDRFLVNT